MKISKTQFFLSIAGLLLILCALNEAVTYATRNSVPRRVMALARQSTGAQILVIGNSLMGAGFDPEAFAKAMASKQEVSSATLALGASTPVEQLLLMRYALQHGMRPKLLVYGFYDFQLTTPVDLSTRELYGNRAMLYYAEPEYGRSFYYLSPHDRIDFEIMRRIPLLVNRSAVWAKVEIFRRRLAQEGLPQERSNKWGRLEDFSLLEAASEGNFVEACQKATSEGLIPAAQQIIRQASDAGMKVVFVEMPMNTEHIRRFYDTPSWVRYRAHLQSMLAADGVTYVDASHWVGEESMFGDHIHLDPTGAMLFSERLGEYLKTQGDLGL